MPVPEFTPEELQSEEWRGVVGKETRYLISSLGRVESVYDPRIPKRGRVFLVPKIGKTGYWEIALSNGMRTNRSYHKVHRLIGTAFLGPLPKGHVTNHKDGNKLNNRLSNLEYVTYARNTQHAFSLGLINMPRPHRESQSKQRTGIVKRLRASGVSVSVLAHCFQITPQEIYRMLHR